MARTHRKVSPADKRKRPIYTPATAADGVVAAFKILDGRWKLLILFHLFEGKLKRFSELERALAGISQKMLAQQLRQLERDGVVKRLAHDSVPPKVEYGLTDWGLSLCPRLDGLLEWIEGRESSSV